MIQWLINRATKRRQKRAKKVYEKSYTPICLLRGIEPRPLSKLITDHHCHIAETGSLISLDEFIKCEAMHVLCTREHLCPDRHLRVV